MKVQFNTTNNKKYMEQINNNQIPGKPQKINYYTTTKKKILDFLLGFLITGGPGILGFFASAIKISGLWQAF